MAAQGNSYAALTCKHCNAHLRVNPENPTVTCEYCGATYRTADLLGEEPAVEEVVVDGSSQTGRAAQPPAGLGKKRLLTIGLVLLLMLCLVRCNVNVADTSSSSGASSVSEPAATPAPGSSASSSSSSASSSSSTSSTFGGSGSTSASSSASANSHITVTPATHANPNAATPAFKEQIDTFETQLNACLQSIADGGNPMEASVNLLFILDELDNIDESSLTAADKQYLRETLSHMTTNTTAVMGSGFKVDLSSGLQGYLN